MPSRVPDRAEAIIMAFELSQAPSRGGFGPAYGLVLRLLLSVTVASIGLPAFAEGKHQQNDAPKLSDPSTARGARGVCEALAAAAANNDLPVDFFTRLIWRESRFEPDAISRKGAQGIAQFMPATARLSGLGNPFNPLEAIAKSGELLRNLRREFGNLGLAAAAYNAGARRVHDWLGGRRPLPQETRAYVRYVTGRAVEEWAAGQTDPVEMPPREVVPCRLPITASVQPKSIERKSDALPPRHEAPQPWGVEVVGGPTPEKALARYREWLPKYAAIVADRKTHVVIHGFLGSMGAVRVRVGEDTREGAWKLCAALRKAGTYCDVLRN